MLEIGYKNKIFEYNVSARPNKTKDLQNVQFTKETEGRTNTTYL